MMVTISHAERRTFGAIIVAEAGIWWAVNPNQMNYKLRDEILSPYCERGAGGIVYFREVPLAVLQRLIDYGFVEMGPWNSSEGVAKVLLPFLKRNPLFTAHGYATSKDRGDARITIEGVERVGDLTKDEIIDFAITFSGADEIQLAADYARAWYD